MNLCILWHLHQPLYLSDPLGQKFFFPWVFLHSIREYYDMGRILMDADPSVKVTFNITPVLWLQILRYIEGNFKDRYIDIYRKNPSFIEEEEKNFILKNFFSVNYKTQILPYKRYAYLFHKRGATETLSEKCAYFSAQELRDIQFLFLFSNVSEIIKDENYGMQELKKKEKNYTEEDKSFLLNISFEVIKKIPLIYKQLIRDEKMSLTTSPFFHPILPLIINSESFSRSSPHLYQNRVHFSEPEDGRVQVKNSVEFIEKEFGIRVKGLWPPEGALSEETLKILIQEGIFYTATDEGILERTIHTEIRAKEKVREELYHPYIYRSTDGEITIFFRDRNLSDKIGFVYKNFDAEDAVRDFLNSLKEIQDLEDKTNPLWVTVVLDGENPWPYYKKGGIEFLKRFYNVLSQEKSLNFSFFEFALMEKNKKVITEFFPGSWIKQDFTTWMGDEEKNKAWKILKKVREELKEEIEKSDKAYFSVLSAQGSDWFWWLGNDNPSFYSNEFDILFREHLKNVYRNIGTEPPLFLEEPIKGYGYKLSIKKPTGTLSPCVDGKITDFYEWANAGIISLQKNKSLLKYLFYGWDNAFLYIRIDGAKSLKKILDENYTLNLYLYTKEGDFICRVSREGVEHKSSKENVKTSCIISVHGIFESKISLTTLNQIFLFVSLEKEQEIFERYPEHGFFILEEIQEELDFW